MSQIHSGAQSWDRVRLGSFLAQRKGFFTIDDFARYRRPRVQLHGKGIVLRDEVNGSEIKTKSQQKAHAGDFLVAEIDAKVGGLGIVPPDLDGVIVSSHYFLFEIDERKCLRAWLDWFAHSGLLEEQVAAQGSTNYAAIRPNHVLDYELPLPPLAEQQRIVARIEALARRVEEARGLRREAVEEGEALLTAARRLIIGNSPDPSWVTLDYYIGKIENGWSPSCEGRPANSDEWGVLKVGAVSLGSFDERQNKALPPVLMPRPEFEVRAGDFLMSRANTLDLVGACAVVKTTRPQLMLSDKIFRFVFQTPILAEPSYLDHVLKSPALREQIAQSASGTSPTMKNISKEKVLALRMPAHAPTEQRRIVAHLDGLQAKVDELKRLQAETQKELDALMPSILARAFAGEL